MTRTLSRLALGLGLTAALLGTCLPALAQTADATAPADGVAMGVPDGIPDRTSAAMNSVYLAASFDAWQQRCMKKEDGADPCELYQLLKDETGNPVAEISFFTLPEGSGCQGEVARWAAIQDNDLKTGHVKIGRAHV